MTTILILMLLGVPAGAPLRAAELDARTNQIASLLRCPVCQGMSVADSPSEMAINIKKRVRELVAQGYSERQILDYFEESYGQFVLLQPKFEGVNTLVWLIPLLAFAAGSVFLFRKLQLTGAKS